MLREVRFVFEDVENVNNARGFVVFMQDQDCGLDVALMDDECTVVVKIDDFTDYETLWDLANEFTEGSI